MKSRLLKHTAPCLLIIPILGIFTFALMKMKWMEKICEKIESKFHEDELMTFCYSAKDYLLINWMDDREFVFQNTWYDVVDKKELGDGSILITVFTDHEETEWFEHFFKTKDHSTSQHTNSSFQQVFKFSYFQNLIVELEDYFFCKDRICLITNLISEEYSSKLYPPPRQV